jgi:hypothetical protein
MHTWDNKMQISWIKHALCHADMPKYQVSPVWCVGDFFILSFFILLITCELVLGYDACAVCASVVATFGCVRAPLFACSRRSARRFAWPLLERACTMVRNRRGRPSPRPSRVHQFINSHDDNDDNNNNNRGYHKSKQQRQQQQPYYKTKYTKRPRQKYMLGVR